MPRGHDTGPHPGRQMSKSNWRGTGVWKVSQPGLGELQTVASDYDEQEMTSWLGDKGGYTAQVEQEEPASGGWETSTYQAGPFRTAYRSQVAAESLGRRITKRSADPYHQGTSYESFEERRHRG